MRKTVIAVGALGAMLCCIQSASARSTLGGIVFTDLYVRSLDADASSTGDQVSATRAELPSITRLRGRWTNEDDVEMYLEVGIGGSSGSTGLSLRHAFGTWTFSSTGQLMAGHSSSPFSPLFPSQAIGNNSEESHNVGKGYGEVSSGRAPQIRYTYRFLNGRGAFAVAILDANQDDEIDSEILGVKASKLPRIDLGMAYNAYNWQIFPSAFVQQREYDGSGQPDETRTSDDSITSWGASLGFRGGSGPFVFAAEANYGENLRNANLSIGESAATANGGAFTFLDPSGSRRLGSSESLGWWVDTGWKFTRGETQGVIHLIAGEMTSERDGVGRERMESRMIGLSAPIDLPWIAKGFRVRPEIFRYENDNEGNEAISLKNGAEIIGGIQLQFTF